MSSSSNNVYLFLHIYILFLFCSMGAFHNVVSVLVWEDVVEAIEWVGLYLFSLDDLLFIIKAQATVLRQLMVDFSRCLWTVDEQKQIHLVVKKYSASSQRRTHHLLNCNKTQSLLQYLGVDFVRACLKHSPSTSMPRAPIRAQKIFFSIYLNKI